MKKTQFGFGCAIAAVLFAVSFAFFSCSNPAGGDPAGGGPPGSQQPAYTVKVEPASITVMKGGTKQFSARLQQNGVDVDDSYPSAVWTITTPVGHSGTKFVPTATLQIPLEETVEALTVQAAITYSGSTYTGTASVTVITQAALTIALGAISDAADADALLEALKATNSGLDVSLVVDANKGAYWERRSDIAGYLSSLTASTPPASINSAINMVSNLIRAINFTELTRTILTAFNGAADAAAIQVLLTEQNIKGLNEDAEDGVWAWELYDALDGKTAIAEAIYTYRTDSMYSYAQDNRFVDSVKLRQAISNAIGIQQYTEASALVSAFSNKIAAEITPLLTQKNFIILNTEWERYNSLNAAGKTQLASKLANRSFSGSSYFVADAIDTAIQEILVEANRGDIQQKLDTAITGNATVAQANELLDLAASVFGYTVRNGDKLISSEQSAYNNLITKAKAGDYSFNAIKAYSQAGANPSETLIQNALHEIRGIISDVKSGVTYATLTVNNLPAGLNYLSVRVYDATTLPTSQNALYQLPYVASISLNATPASPAVLGLRWPGSFTGSKDRNFVVTIDGSGSGGGYISKVGLVAFDAGGNATVNVTSLEDTQNLQPPEPPPAGLVNVTSLEDTQNLGRGTLTISNLGSASYISVYVYSTSTVPTTQAEFNNLSYNSTLILGNGYSSTGTQPVSIHWYSEPPANGTYVITVNIGDGDTIGTAAFTSGNATVDLSQLTNIGELEG